MCDNALLRGHAAHRRADHARLHTQRTVLGARGSAMPTRPPSDRTTASWATPPGAPSRTPTSTARTIPRPVSRSCGTSTSGQTVTARHRSSIPTGTAVSSCPSTTRARQASVKLSQRYEPGYEETRGDIFRGEKRIDAFGVARRRSLRRPRHRCCSPTATERRTMPDPRRIPQRRHLGLRSDAAPRAAHLFGTAHGRGRRNGLHPRRPAQLQRHRSPVRVGVPRRSQADLPLEHHGQGVPVREGPQLRPVRPFLRQRSLGAARRLAGADEPQERRPPVPPQGHLDRQAEPGAALLLRVRPQGGAVEDSLARQALERGYGPDRRVVRGLGRRSGAASPAGRERHDRQRADGHGQSHRVLGCARHTAQEQGQDPPFHRRRATDEGTLKGGPPNSWGCRAVLCLSA